MMKRNKIAIQLSKGLMLLSIALFSCQKKKETETFLPPQFQKGPIIQVLDKDIALPSLTSHHDKTYASWVEQSEKTSRLYFAELVQNELKNTHLIAEGEDWFVNWADYPQIRIFEDGSLLTVFLKKSGPGTFAYDVMYTLSKNGKEWTVPQKLHDDVTQTEHGFVSMSPWGKNMLITWLDGRNTAGGNGHNHDHGHQGQMSLRAALLDSKGIKLNDWLLDDRVCDCCQTGSTVSQSGPAVVFRDRSATEIRDIGFISWDGSHWNETKIVNMDLWEIPACPVNGPRIASLGNTLAIAWFTAAQDRPEVKLVFSEDNGNSFGTPIHIGLGKTIGRVALQMLDDQHAFVIWMEEGKLLGKKVAKTGKTAAHIEIAASSEKRSSGFPQMTITGNHIWVAWTDDSQPKKQIKTAYLNKASILAD
ncbi:exo-alpha-sialidase [Cecembia calidifontis]|jgi:hypothetical protein|uniref:BNR repeat protein n=1 Tax=Cecembia calidifontis TaxID=1187080 RepID=A0A4Q7P5E3_9BACT|nr:exo-alpha-sialidase [Cecembia calidifontis]RZS95161.1 hypothetical protein BC751_0677 [Cecembia calidifontis]